MTDLPADAREYCRDLARLRRWPPGPESAFLETVRWFRDIDEGPASRSYYEGAGEDADSEGTRWLWETVIVAGKVIAVKQIEVSPDGMARCYCWRHLEDERGSSPIRRSTRTAGAREYRAHDADRGMPDQAGRI
jgi:hypothetical protein